MNEVLMQGLSVFQGIDIKELVFIAASVPFGLFLLPMVLNLVFSAVDSGLLFIDKKIIDKIPIKFIRDNIQERLISRLNKRIEKYKFLIKEIQK